MSANRRIQPSLGANWSPLRSRRGQMTGNQSSAGAKFGQPEINIGVTPGAGGSQRLPRAIGKSKAMLSILTGEPMTAAEAERAGLVARVTVDELVVEDALALAAQIAMKSPVAVRL